MDLNDRKRKILQAIIDEYIGTAEPVGSRSISKNKELGLSSATIRNEMADLEDMGYLIQPHTSSGRIPSDSGYRFYVSTLMTRYRIGMESIAAMQREMRAQLDRLDSIIKRASVIAAAMTDYTTIISTPSTSSARIQKIDFVALNGALMIIAVTDTGTVKHDVMRANIDARAAVRLAEIFSRKLGGLAVAEIESESFKELLAEVQEALSVSAKEAGDIVRFAYTVLSSLDEREVYLNNARSILNYPEYRDVTKAKRVLDFLDDKRNIGLLLSGAASDEGVSVKIGAENGFDELNECSIVTVNYQSGAGGAGRIGVIGPKRMNYAKVFASLDVISKQIDDIFELYMESE